MTRLTPLSLALVTASLTLSSAMAATDDMQNMDHSQMPGMDHSQMQSMDDGQMQPAAPTESRTPIPALTDADRAAVYASPSGHKVHDTALNHYLLADKLEWQDADDGSTLAWDLSGWIGGDIDRLWLRSEGERTNGKTEDAEIQALWGHVISPWWDVVTGIRQDFKPGDPQTWAAFGVQG
ncbi:copper resistance protein B, partial [Pseudomonas rossensis]